MGMDVYLLEVVEDGEWDFSVDPDDFPREYLVDMFEEAEEFINMMQIYKDKDIDPEEVCGIGFKKEGIEIITPDKSVLVPDEELTQKYVYTEPIKKIWVKELAYVGFGYMGDYFKIHPFFQAKDARKILRSYYFDPVEMEKAGRMIFRPECIDGWMEIVNKFREALASGKKVFVWISK